MEKLYCLIRVAFQTKFAYIKAFWFNIFGTTVSILIYYFLWKYVFMSREELHGFTAVQMTTYVVLSPDAFLPVFGRDQQRVRGMGL